jgi:ribosomal protein L27
MASMNDQAKKRMPAKTAGGQGIIVTGSIIYTV